MWVCLRALRARWVGAGWWALALCQPVSFPQLWSRAVAAILGAEMNGCIGLACPSPQSAVSAYTRCQRTTFPFTPPHETSL
jgi:hypothetical protein